MLEKQNKQTDETLNRNGEEQDPVCNLMMMMTERERDCVPRL